MKILISKYTNRFTDPKKLKQKYSSVHSKSYSNVTNEFYSKSIIINDEEETLVNDSANTNSNETGHTIIIKPGEIYNLINNVLPERKSVTDLKQSAINKFIEGQDGYKEIKPKLTQLGFITFFDNIYTGRYNHIIENKGLVDFYNNMYKSLDVTSSFYLSIKDSLGNEFSRTNVSTQDRVGIKDTSLLQAAINDTTTTNKDGFNVGEHFYLFYINTYYNVEFPINFDASGINTTIQDKGQTIISNLFIKLVFLKQFNRAYYQLLVPLK